MQDKDFFERLKALLQKTREEYGLTNLHDAFIVWYAENALQMDAEEVIERIVTDTHGEGVDAVLVDNNEMRLIFLQAKTVTDYLHSQRNLSENDIKTTLEGVRFLIFGDYKGKITPDLENLIDEYHEKANTGEYTTQLVFLVLKQPPLDEKFIDAFEKDVEVEVEIMDFDRVKTFYEEEYLSKLSPPPKKISLQAISGILKKNSPYKAFVFTVKAREIARLYSEHRETIFQQNVRYFLGMRARNINKQIYQTATDGERAQKFWYFNNGVTVVCEKVELVPSGKVVILRHPQIINGAQTTYALYKAYEMGDLQDDAEILLRVIEAKDRPLVEEITLYTNSQNAIRLRDLCSNDKVQIRIQKVLRGYGYFYERKRGEFEALYPTTSEKKKAFGKNYKGRIVSNEKAAQAFLALYLGYPAQAKSGKGRIFMKGEGGFYDKVFKEEDSILPEKLLLAWKLLKYIERRKKKFKEKFSDNEDEFYRMDFILHSEYFILNLFADFLGHRGYDYGKREIIMELVEKTEADELIEEIYQQITEIMAEYITLLKNDEPGYYHNKFFKSERSIGRVRDFFKGKGFKFVST